jgi:hypothetical protein
MTHYETMWAAASLVAAAVIATLMVAVGAYRRHERLMRDDLRWRFGPEYERAVEQFRSQPRAERELASRARRIEHIRPHVLNESDRARFAATWERIQGQFVDDPQGTVVGANELIKEVMRAQGYPAGDEFDQRVADLSVDHAGVVQHYRAARALSESMGLGEPNTEELRQAVVHYRALFSDLLKSGISPTRRFRELHAS